MKKSTRLTTAALLAAAVASTAGPAAGEQAPQQQQQQQQQAKQNQSEYKSAEKFKDMPVKSTQGQEIGTITKTIVDMKSGQVAYFILGRGGLGGMGKENYIVPWNAVKPDPQGKAMTLQVQREKLRLAPPGEDVEKQLTRQMGQEIAQHYGLAPYWEGSGQQQPGGSQPQSPQPQQPPQQQPPPGQSLPQQPPAQPQQPQ